MCVLFINLQTPQDMLGRQQWEWLEHILTETEAEVTIIGSGIQVRMY